MKAINHYLIIDKVKEAPKKVGGLELTEKQNKDEIDYLVQDIQALCREIAYDTGKYKRVGQDDN